MENVAKMMVEKLTKKELIMEIYQLLVILPLKNQEKQKKQQCPLQKAVGTTRKTLQKRSKTTQNKKTKQN